MAGMMRIFRSRCTVCSMTAPFPICYERLLKGHCHRVLRSDGDIFYRLRIGFFSYQTLGIRRGCRCFKAGVPCGDAPQDQGHHVLRVFRPLQPPVDGVGQADGVLRGSVSALCRRRVLRRLPWIPPKIEIVQIWQRQIYYIWYYQIYKPLFFIY